MKTLFRVCTRGALVGLCLVTMGQSGPCGEGLTERFDNRNDFGQVVAPATLGGSFEATDFIVPAGQTTRISSDLVVNASGKVTVEGQLLADPASGSGYSITINATGDVEIVGTIEAGNGAKTGTASQRSIAQSTTGENGHHGGSVKIITPGSISVVSGSVVKAGSGTSGTPCARGGAGGNGGSVVLCAGKHLKVVGAIQIGDGGCGGDATTTSGNSGPSQFENRGGDSGFLYVDATTYDWPGLNTVDMSLDPFTYGLSLGGYGGDAGFVLISDDAVACVGIAGVIGGSTAIHAAQQGGGIVGTLYKERRAAAGGHGWRLGGAGGAIQLIACSYDGRDGESWSARAGDGGSVTRHQDTSLSCVAWPIVLQGAIGGGGGIASALVAPGLLGDRFSPNGGHGGSVESNGGNGGHGEFFASHSGGNGGRAHASGGFGGSGYSHSCEDRGAGGGGGGGGDAEARGGDGGNGAIPGHGSEGIAAGTGPGDVASRGGDGGAGVPVGGLPGTGGNLASIQGADGSATLPAISGQVEHHGVAPDGTAGASFAEAWCQD